ncbi:MAG: ABC transporter permease subunit [Planctomycetaceae bacterium]|nr:ABC transporter permease subunit [Planctomycetaceae bacterium]
MAQAQRGKAIMTAEADGSLRAIHLTAERVYITQATKVAGVPAICFPAKGDGIVTIDGKGGLHHWWMEAPHAEASWKAFFGKVHYEHHDHPKWDWQTSSGTDDVEPKHSLMPLVAGTFKGALYAMLFSIPIAILAAIYTSEFMSFRLRAIIKPVVEIMASLPSVVLGFLVLVVAPLADPNMPAILLFFIIMPAVFMIFGWLWQQMPPVITGKLGPWRTFIVLFVFLGFAAWLCLAIGPRMEYHLFPKTEATDLALIDAKTFRPHNDEIAGRLDAGHFGSWTSGGAELAGRSAQLRKVDHESKAETFSIELVNGVKEKFKQYVASLPPDKVSVDGSGAITVNDESVSLPPGALRLNKDKKIVFKDSAIPAGASITEYGVTTTVLNTLPKGWWNPGGHGLFQVVALFIFIPLVVLGLRVTFTGMGFFKYQFHIWKQREGQWHPLKTVAAIKGRFEGDRSGTLRPVMVDIVFAGLYASLVLAIAYGLVLAVGPWIEGLLFTYDHPTAGQVVDFRRALLGEEGWKFEQKNSFIVGVAMGFAVIPIIYTISEDALQSVPNQLRAASLACGASAWQTAARVAVPAALPGIFSAVVVGLGRAVGETMIVVMAAGGTPIMDMQPFNGFRSLSAAIATEMPEAPQDGTLYRTLFLAGLLLFVMTFVVNTIAEVIRIRLRRKMARV